MTEEEEAAIYARAEREGWDRFTLGMVLIGALDPNEMAKCARINESAKLLRGLPVNQWPEIQVGWGMSVELSSLSHVPEHGGRRA